MESIQSDIYYHRMHRSAFRDERKNPRKKVSLSFFLFNFFGLFLLSSSADATFRADRARTEQRLVGGGTRGDL